MVKGRDANTRQNAQALKLRLQFAMYKLQTHQEHVPLSHVQVVAKNPRFPHVLSSPKLAATREASRAASPAKSPPAAYSTGDSRRPSANQSLANDSRPQQQNNPRVAAHELAVDDTEDEDESRQVGRDMVSPVERPGARMPSEGYASWRNNIGLSTVSTSTPERQDRLLSLVDAIESAEKLRDACV